MPYALRKDVRCPNGKPYAVVKKSDQSVVPGGCHETREQAEKHLAALEANVPDARKY